MKLIRVKKTDALSSSDVAKVRMNLSQALKSLKDSSKYLMGKLEGQYNKDDGANIQVYANQIKATVDMFTEFGKRLENYAKTGKQW